MKNKTKFLFILNVDWFLISHRLPIVQKLLEQGHEVHVAAHITDKRAELESFGMIVHPLKMERGSTNPLHFLLTLYEIFKVILNVKPDILHLVTIKPVLLGGIAARFLKVPAVVFAISGLGSVFHGTGIKRSVQRMIASLLYRLALNHPNKKVIFQNSNDRDVLRTIKQLADEEVELVPGSGVDLNKFRPLPDGQKSPPPIIMFAGRLLKEKGVLEFIETAKHFLSANIDNDMKAKFVLVGQPDPANPSSVTQFEIDHWVEEGIIDYWGFRSDMENVLPQATIFCYPSYYGEGLAKVLLEAAACGCVIITTDHPGCREAVLDGITGKLVEKKSVTDIINSITELLRHEQKLYSFSKEARQLAINQFDETVVVEKHIEIYRCLIKQVK